MRRARRSPRATAPRVARRLAAQSHIDGRLLKGYDSASSVMGLSAGRRPSPYLRALAPSQVRDIPARPVLCDTARSSPFCVTLLSIAAYPTSTG